MHLCDLMQPLDHHTLQGYIQTSNPMLALSDKPKSALMILPIIDPFDRHNGLLSQ